MSMRAGTPLERETVDLSAYPDLVVLYLGMRVNLLRGVATLLGFGPKIDSAARAKPDGLLGHERIIYSLLPLHIGSVLARFRKPRALVAQRTAPGLVA